MSGDALPDARIAELEALHEAGTAVPWIADSGSAPLGDTGEYDAYWCVRVERKRSAHIAHLDSDEDENEANLPLIVAARNALPALLAEIARLKGENLALAKIIKNLTEPHGCTP